MPARQPEGEPAPPSGALPVDALRGVGRDRPLGVYVHVPFCVTRCGYCDFNTYTGGDHAGFVDAVALEVTLAASVLRDRGPVSTVYFGGGTPTLLGAGVLSSLLGVLRDRLGLAREAEVTVEANPDSVDLRALAALRSAGFTRVSFGVQSVRPHVLSVLERLHDPGRALAALGEARAAGFDHVSGDLIYGTPGESDDDWRASLEAVVDCGVDHVSTYGLVVEPGTRLAAQVRSGAVPRPDPDVQERRYAIADEVLGAAGFGWYELASWARGPAARCRHNEGYWRSADWWGFGPGAHSHVGGVRWWNRLRPADYAAALQAGRSPARARETVGAQQHRLERLLLETRLAEGLDTGLAAPAALDRLRADGLVELRDGRAVLTLRGRQSADAVVQALA